MLSKSQCWTGRGSRDRKPLVQTCAALWTPPPRCRNPAVQVDYWRWRWLTAQGGGYKICLISLPQVNLPRESQAKPQGRAGGQPSPSDCTPADPSVGAGAHPQAPSHQRSTSCSLLPQKKVTRYETGLHFLLIDQSVFSASICPTPSVTSGKPGQVGQSGVSLHRHWDGFLQLTEAEWV